MVNYMGARAGPISRTPDGHQVCRPHRHLRRDLSLRQGQYGAFRGALAKGMSGLLGSFGIALVATSGPTRAGSRRPIARGRPRSPKKSAVALHRHGRVSCSIFGQPGYLYVLPAGQIATSTASPPTQSAAIGPSPPRSSPSSSFFPSWARPTPTSYARRACSMRWPRMELSSSPWPPSIRDSRPPHRIVAWLVVAPAQRVGNVRTAPGYVVFGQWIFFA